MYYHRRWKFERHWVCFLSNPIPRAVSFNVFFWFVSRAAALAYAHAGAKHLYLLDFDGENLPELKQTIQSTYPDVKVWIKNIGHLFLK